MTPEVAHVRALLAEYDPRCELLRMVRPRDGLAGTVLFLTTTREELVLKIFPDDPGSWKPEKEQAVYAHMASLGIPVPVVRHRDASKRVVPFVYSLAGRVEGEPFSKAFTSLSETENTALYAALGEFLGRLHATTFDRFGNVCATAESLRVGSAHGLDTGGGAQGPGPFVAWHDMHRAIVETRLRLMEGTEFEALTPVVRAYFARHQNTLDLAIVPRLLHMDLHRGNVLVANGEVVGILDVDEAIVGHNEYDLMRTELANFRGESPALAQAFLHRYTAHVPLDEGYDMRKDFYEVSRTLVWIECLIRYGDRYAQGLASHSHQAARQHLLALTTER